MSCMEIVHTYLHVYQNLLLRRLVGRDMYSCCGLQLLSCVNNSTNMVSASTSEAESHNKSQSKTSKGMVVN